MSKDRVVHYEGWLIKSPPTKRIWRARWRRRWFTLKQGEIPEQFCLEYYTDRNCRKLKGVIDLDQCEQVDCGLRLENSKQKFQFMFDIKTPKRTYYLAADTEADMRDWVNCICQVCHLHDTKQSNELLDEHGLQKPTSAIGAFTNSTNNTTTTSLSLNTSSGPSTTSVSHSQSFNNNGILRRPTGVVDQQPQGNNKAGTCQNNSNNNSNNNNNSDCVYVNAEYSSRETLPCDVRLDGQHLPALGASSSVQTARVQQQGTAAATPSSPGAALYLNSPVFQQLQPLQPQSQPQPQMEESARLAVNANGVVRKLPENLVLNNTPLPDAQQHSVQPSPALSTASGPYIPISECFSGSPKFNVDGNNPITPLNNLDPKFYHTPRSHNNIGLNLTNDQSYSPKITNYSLQQQMSITSAKGRTHRSDSDSESVFTDDDEWSHPMPLRENADRSTRPSESSVENESFVVTYSQRFSKLPDEAGKESPSKLAGLEGVTADPLAKLAKALKNKNNLILDFVENEKMPREVPQLSDTENTSPAIGPLDASSVVEETYDIPRSHQLPYYNLGQLFEKVTSPTEANPIAASTPNLLSSPGEAGSGSPVHGRTLPRSHYYTNAAPTRIEGNVFRYDFVEQSDLPPVNRNLKPKVNIEDKPPEEVPAKPPIPTATATATATTTTTPSGIPQNVYGNIVDPVISKMSSIGLQGPENLPQRPPSVDRNLKPNAFKGNSSTMKSTSRRSTGAPLSMVLLNERDNYVLQTHTLPRQPRFGNSAQVSAGSNASKYPHYTPQHQRTASAVAAMQCTSQTQSPIFTSTQSSASTQLSPPKNEYKLQYFDLDVANPPPINRQGTSAGNSQAPSGSRLGLSANSSASSAGSVVYNSVDFVKTEAFQRIREERKKESQHANAANAAKDAK